MKKILNQLRLLTLLPFLASCTYTAHDKNEVSIEDKVTYKTSLYTKDLEICEKITKILNHESNRRREAKIPGRMFNIPDGFDEFKTVNWEAIPENAWYEFYDNKLSSAYSGLKQMSHESIEKSYFDANGDGKKEWFIRYVYYTPKPNWNGIPYDKFSWWMAPAKFEKTFIENSFMDSWAGYLEGVPFIYKNKVYFFDASSELAKREISILNYTFDENQKKNKQNIFCIYNQKES